MNNNKQHKYLNKIRGKTSLNCGTSTNNKKNNSLRKTNGVTNSSFPTNTKVNTAGEEQNATSDIKKYLEITQPSCTSSTDFEVNINKYEITPLSSLSLESFESATAGSQFHKQFSNNNKNEIRLSNVNNKVNNYNSINNNSDNDIDHEDKNGNDNAEKFDNILKMTYVNGGGKCTRYHQKGQNIVRSKNAINLSHQQNWERLTRTETMETTVTAGSSNKQPLEQNEFIKLPHFPTSTSSNTDSYNGTLLSNMQLYNRSPVVSIRSIASTIITSDSESDADVNTDIEGDCQYYVIKKLGTHTTPSPNDQQIPNINSGHTVLNQRVIPNSNQETLPPLAALADIGDRIGAPQSLGPASTISAGTQRLQIGSIALSNSSDVTFGDKHFYEGPVTIQQFLLDGRDKWKHPNGEDNTTFSDEKVETSSNNSKDIDSFGKASTLYEHIWKRKKVIILGVLAFTTMLVVATILGIRTLNGSKSKLVLGNNEESRNIIPITSTIAKDNVGGGYVLRIVVRDGWLAQPPINPGVKLNLPVERVIVIPTRTSECETQAACTYTVRITQTYNIESQQQDDIIYNFLIGGDGNVYEGRGWNNRGSVIKGFNDDSVSIAYIGSFKKQPPSYKQLNVTKLLLQEGVRLKKLSSDYTIVGANKLDPTSVSTLADALYKSFENWSHWST